MALDQLKQISKFKDTRYKSGVWGMGFGFN